MKTSARANEEEFVFDKLNDALLNMDVNLFSNDSVFQTSRISNNEKESG